MAMNIPGFYEFFAGGGMARAGIGEGWRCLFANDIDPKKAKTYRSNWGEDVLLEGDVTKIRTSQLPDRADLVWASFPCQDLSVAGSGAGLAGARSGMFWPFWSLMKSLAREGRKPRSIIIENVCGLLTSHGGADFALLTETVAADGYWIGAIVADAAHFVPQSRPRLFVIAIDCEEAIAGRVQLPYAADLWHPTRLRLAQAQLNQQARTQWLWFAPGVPALSNVSLSDLIEDNPSGVAWHSEDETQRLLNMMSPINRTKVALVAKNGGKAVGTIYKRTRHECGKKVQRAEVRFDMAGCLRTPGGGSSRQTVIVVENERVRTRLISPRETARLMGLPEHYELPKRYNDAYHVTGDGVAVPVVRHIVQDIIEPCLRASTFKVGHAA
jgi:DNA (cytosine-5)-methyltransferase 1